MSARTVTDAKQGPHAPPPPALGEDYAAVQVVAPSLGSVMLPNVVGPNFGTYANAIFMAGSTPGPFFQSRMTWNGAGWNLTRTEGTSYVFGFQQPLQDIQDRFGNRISLGFQQVVPATSSGYSFSFFAGVAFDGRGGVALYYGYGLGYGTDSGLTRFFGTLATTSSTMSTSGYQAPCQ